MQANTVVASCKVIYGSGLSAGDKLDAIGALLGSAGGAATNRATNAPRRAAAQSTTATPRSTATRGRRRTATAKETPQPLRERVYDLIPETTGIAQADIKLRGVPANQIGAALSRLRKAGRLVERSGVWFRSSADQQRAAA